MVCLGNICRSPIAEGVLAEKCKAMGLDWKVDSAGTNGLHNGEKPHPIPVPVPEMKFSLLAPMSAMGLFERRTSTSATGRLASLRSGSRRMRSVSNAARWALPSKRPR